MHPFRRWLDRRDLTQQQALAKARELGGTLSAGHLSDVLAGKSMPSLSTLMLLARVSDDEVEVSTMARWHSENAPVVAPVTPEEAA